MSDTSLDETLDHVRGAAGGRLVLQYGDYRCPYSRVAYHAVQAVQREVGDGVRFAFRHFPLIDVLPHALAAARAAEAAARQERFWDMSDLLFDRQGAFVDDGPRSYAVTLGLDLATFDADRTSRAVLDRVRRDIESGKASRQVNGTPALFIDGVLHRGGYDTASLLTAVRTDHRREGPAADGAPRPRVRPCGCRPPGRIAYCYRAPARSGSPPAERQPGRSTPCS